MKNIFVYGGCVTRDAYTLLQDEHHLTAYVARQSLISATSTPTPDLPSPALKSTFQKRMVLHDYRSTLPAILEEKAAETDVIVMDTNIERLGVFKMSEESYITRSSEFIRGKVLNRLDAQPQWIPPRAPEHPGLYAAAVQKFVHHLDALNLKHRVLVIDAPMASHDNEGTAFEKYEGRPVAELGTQLRALTGMLGDAGLHVARMPEELAIADVNHQWGRTPLHYIPEATQWVADQIVTHSN